MLSCGHVDVTCCHFDEADHVIILLVDDRVNSEHFFIGKENDSVSMMLQVIQNLLPSPRQMFSWCWVSKGLAMSLWDLPPAALMALETAFLQTPFFLTISLMDILGSAKNAFLAVSGDSLVGLPLWGLSLMSSPSSCFLILQTVALLTLRRLMTWLVFVAGTHEGSNFLPFGLHLGSMLCYKLARLLI